MTGADWDDLPADRAIPELVRLHGGRLYGLGLRLCGSAADAEDLVQETFLAAYRAWDGFEGRSDPRTWLYTIAARACTRLHRKRAGQPARMAEFDELLPFGADRLGVPPRTPDGLEELLRKEGIERVEQAIVGLPLDFRLPLVLKEIVGLSIAEVAGVLGLPPGTVKTRVHRGRLRIRQALDDALPQEELPPAAYSRQVCLDLLQAKQEALDHGVPLADDIVCDRCQAVFASLDLGQDICRRIGAGDLPDDVRARLLQRLAD